MNCLHESIVFPINDEIMIPGSQFFWQLIPKLQNEITVFANLMMYKPCNPSEIFHGLFFDEQIFLLVRINPHSACFRECAL